MKIASSKRLSGNPTAKYIYACNVNVQGNAEKEEICVEKSKLKRVDNFSFML